MQNRMNRRQFLSVSSIQCAGFLLNDHLLAPQLVDFSQSNDVSDLIDGVLYAGYEQVVSISEMELDDIVTEIHDDADRLLEELEADFG